MPNRDPRFGLDAIALLTDEHEEIRQLFERYANLVDEVAGDTERQALAEHIGTLLTVHTTLEEEIFYPAARDAIDDEELLNEAQVEHNSASDLIEQLDGMDPSDELFDATVTVLGEYVEHHVQKEEGELFPALRNSDLDMQALGEELSERRQELLAEDDEDEDDEI
jgi:hemerythrin-like domain-containing protein